MTDDITPALTETEWTQVRHAGAGDYNNAIMAHSVALASGRQHALAALCLYQQPFGFTRDDVSAIRMLGDKAQRDVLRMIDDPTNGLTGTQRARLAMNMSVDLAPLYSLASRIAALLPPEKQ